jgi:hypothetical protein
VSLLEKKLLLLPTMLRQVYDLRNSKILRWMHDLETIRRIIFQNNLPYYDHIIRNREKH